MEPCEPHAVCVTELDEQLQRVNTINSIRTLSLERILGDKAETFF